MDKKAKIKKYKDIAERYAKAVAELGIPVEAAYVFGSRVKGTETSQSDIDTCIVSPVFGVDPIADRVVLMKIKRGVNDLIEPHPFSVEEFNDVLNPLAAEIKRTGVRII